MTQCLSNNNRIYPYHEINLFKWVVYPWKSWHLFMLISQASLYDNLKTRLYLLKKPFFIFLLNIVPWYCSLFCVWTQNSPRAPWFRAGQATDGERTCPSPRLSARAGAPLLRPETRGMSDDRAPVSPPASSLNTAWWLVFNTGLTLIRILQSFVATWK